MTSAQGRYSPVLGCGGGGGGGGITHSKISTVLSNLVISSKRCRCLGLGLVPTYNVSLLFQCNLLKCTPFTATKLCYTQWSDDVIEDFENQFVYWSATLDVGKGDIPHPAKWLHKCVFCSVVTVWVADYIKVLLELLSLTSLTFHRRSHSSW